MPDSVPHFFIRNMIPVRDAQKSSEASDICRMSNSAVRVHVSSAQEDRIEQGTHHSDFATEGNRTSLSASKSNVFMCAYIEHFHVR